MAEVVDAPVVRVELFEDRAAVTRRVTLPEAGRHQLRLGPLTPLVGERTVSFPGRLRAVVEEVRVRRERVRRTEADPAQVSALATAWADARDAARAQEDVVRRADEARARAQQALAAARDATGRALQELEAPAAWVRGLETLAARQREATLALAEARIAFDVLREEAARLDRDLGLAREGAPALQGFLDLAILTEEPGDLLVRYVVPCAVWRPAHRAELSTRGRSGRVDWELRAVCWNATGEDWSGVALTCSTARPGDLASPPSLADDVVHSQPRDREIVVEARDEEVQVAREAGTRGASAVPGVDDGGEPRTFTAEGPVDLPSSGRPLTVPLDRWSSDASVRWQALPEQSSAVVLRSTQANAGSRPLLAGPVELLRDGEGIGRGRVALVAPGEPFTLGWGSHDGIRVVRRRDHDVDRAVISGRQTHRFDVRLDVSHAGDEACRVELRERLPVSELSAVTVSPPTAEPKLDAPVDGDGFVTWSLELAPGDHRTLKLEYTVDAASNVVLPF